MKFTFLARIFSLCLCFVLAILLVPNVEAQSIGAPTGFTGSDKGSTKFTVSWSAPTTTKTIIGYDVRYKPTGGPTYTDAGHTGTTTSITLTGLTPNTPYMVRVRAVTETENGTWSVPFVYTTLSQYPLDAPTGLTVSNTGSTGFTVSWTAPTETSGLTITGYAVRYRLATGSTYTNKTATGTSITLTDLTHSTSYAVQVRALAGTEKGLWSTTSYYTTLSQYPINPPTGLTVSNKGSTGFTVSWTAPTGTSGLTITGYKVEYRTASSSDYTDAGHTGTSTSITLTGLTHSTGYVVEIRALAGTEKSVWSDPLYTATLSQYPINAPTGLTVSDRSSTGFTVSWTAPTETSGLTITGYEVKYRIATSSDESDAGHTGTSTSVDLTGLTQNKAYAVRIRALAGTEKGLWSTSVYTSTVASTADVVPVLSSEEQVLLSSLLTYDTLIFNELHNGSDDANDWLELRNVSPIDIPLANWQLSVQTGSGTAVIPFPDGTVMPAGEVLLITNREIVTAAVVVEDFVLPQADFALILRSPTAFGDLAGNYFQGQKERPETAPAFTVDTVWERVQTTVSGYRAEAWAVSTHRNGLGSPGYQPSAVTGDLNNDSVVNILDLVLVASKFGATGITAADLNGDMTVNIQDLVLVANAFSNVGAAPTGKQSTAATVNNWLQLARQNESKVVKTSVPKGLSYDRGIVVLEQLARALTPNKTVLLANYPNPFNPETWIPYQLSKAADVKITIYASDGNVVRTLELGHRDVGMYKNRSQAAYWDGKNETGESVASGVYFYTLTTSDFSATRKMLILK